MFTLGEGVIPGLLIFNFWWKCSMNFVIGWSRKRTEATIRHYLATGVSKKGKICGQCQLCKTLSSHICLSMNIITTSNNSLPNWSFTHFLSSKSHKSHLRTFVNSQTTKNCFLPVWGALKSDNVCFFTASLPRELPFSKTWCNAKRQKELKI